MKRRSFLTHLAHGAAVPGVLGTMGFKLPAGHSMKSLLRLATEQDKVLVLIFLEGGNDGLNTVIPMDQLSNLNRVRPHVVLPEDKLISLPQSEVALHPSMSDLAALYREGRFQVIQNVGYPLPNYSHFRSTDIWMSGSDSDELLNSGLAGRYLTDVFPGYPEVYPTESMPDPLAVEIGYGGSLLFQGPEAAMSMVISDPNFFYELVDNEEQVAPNTPAGDKLKYVRLIERQSQQYGEIVKSAAEKANNSVDYPETLLGEQLKIVSRLIAGGLKTPIYMVRLGGFDTHDAQVEASDHTKGEHAELLKVLNDAISAFMKDTDALRTSDKVLGMTFSEFGRRIVSNASLGTDHGAAAPMFIFGNHLVGGVTGSNPIISPSAIYDDNLPWEFDFRQVYASVFDQWFEAGSGTISNSMLNDYATTPIIGDTRILDLSSPSADRGISVYPNPVTSHATIFVSDIRSPIMMTVIDLSGRVVAKPFTGKLSSQQFEWDASELRPGRYVLAVQGSNWQKSFAVLKK